MPESGTPKPTQPDPGRAEQRVIRTIPMLQHDKNRAEDLDTEAEDHAADSVRYACMSRPYIRADPSEPKPVWSYQGTNGGSNIVGNVPIIELIRRKERARRE